jgi:hypothetical protein
MRAFVKVVTARRELSNDQKDALRRAANMLREHDFSVLIILKDKVKSILKIKAV